MEKIITTKWNKNNLWLIIKTANKTEKHLIIHNGYNTNKKIKVAD